MSVRGFTLIELLVCLAILGVIAVLTVPVAEVAAQRAKENELRTSLRELRNAIDAYKRANDEGRIQRVAGQSGYPTSLKVLVGGVPDQKDPQRSQIYFLRRIPRDPTFSDASVAAEDTWGLRCYASSAEEPEEGEDVFDIFSLSKGKGLNGVPYREW
ncbi:MAG: type II secretion system protein [Uliginosibacterium sp.]|jgi:general secretion pathway protein G|nr:type II secretion system protein [Uliginosibacterium sp.]